MSEPIKRRIVINLDSAGHNAARGGQAYQGPRAPRRWPKLVAIFLILILVAILGLATGAYLWWRHYKTTPAYSIALIIDAAQRNDMTAFQKQVDDDAIARNLVTDVSQKASSRYGIALSSTVKTQIDTLVPTLLPRLKEMIHEEVAKEIKEFASKSEPKPFIVVALGVPALVSISTDGDKARAIATVPNRKFEFALERNGDLWKVTEFKDDVLVQRVVDSVMKDLPAIGTDVATPLLKALRKPSKRAR